MFLHADAVGIGAALLSSSLSLYSPTAAQPEPQRLAAHGLAAALVAVSQNCLALELASGAGTEAVKTVSRPTILPFGGRATASLRNNWNTDWIVPNNQLFQQFVVTMVPHTTGQYDIKMFLKYSDGTADNFYDQRGTQLIAEQPLRVDAQPRSTAQPFQVNILVGGLNSEGNRYTASVAACLSRQMPVVFSRWSN
jgi:hypothetical protein